MSGQPTIPDDNMHRNLALARPDTDPDLPHIGLVGDTYTILLSGDDTAGRYCLIDMHIPPGGGPHRTATISKRPSPSSRASSMPHSGERNSS
jgi:hypothetical protein